MTAARSGHVTRPAPGPRLALQPRSDRGPNIDDGTLAERSLLAERRLADDSAAELLRTMAALPRTHPSRNALREQAIEAWLPLAHNLANRFANRGEPLDDI